MCAEREMTRSPIRDCSEPARPQKHCSPPRLLHVEGRPHHTASKWHHWTYRENWSHRGGGSPGGKGEGRGRHTGVTQSTSSQQPFPSRCPSQEMRLIPTATQQSARSHTPSTLLSRGSVRTRRSSLQAWALCPSQTARGEPAG